MQAKLIPLKKVFEKHNLYRLIDIDFDKAETVVWLYRHEQRLFCLFKSKGKYLLLHTDGCHFWCRDTVYWEYYIYDSMHESFRNINQLFYDSIPYYGLYNNLRRHLEYWMNIIPVWAILRPRYLSVKARAYIHDRLSSLQDTPNLNEVAWFVDSVYGIYWKEYFLKKSSSQIGSIQPILQDLVIKCIAKKEYHEIYKKICNVKTESFVIDSFTLLYDDCSLIEFEMEGQSYVSLQQKAYCTSF